MGGCFSREEAEKEPLSRPKYSWEREDRPDRSQLIISDQDGVMVGRLPGQLNGRQFKIQNCKDCRIFVLDHTDTVTVDKCNNCQIVIGPSRGSVFLRDCSECVCVVACQQFRTRDCKKCQVFLHCTSQPVIESCFKMKFSCYQCCYPQLKAQFTSSKLSIFNNQWSAVHDFTTSLEESNWSLTSKGDPMIDVPTEGEFSDVGLSFERETSVVPHTIGPKQKPHGEGCLVVFFAQEDIHKRAQEFLQKIEGKVQLAQTREVALNTHETESLFSGNDAVISLANQGSCVLVEICGESCVDLCKAQLEAQESVYVSPNPDQGRNDVKAFASFNEMSLSMQ